MGATGELRRSDAERLFEQFVRNANTVAPAVSGRSVQAAGGGLSDGPASAPMTVSAAPRRRRLPVELDAADTLPMAALSADAAREVLEALQHGKRRKKAAARSSRPSEPPVRVRRVVPVGGLTPEARQLEDEAKRVVPDVARVTPPPPPVPEGVEDGQIPAGELERLLTDMQVLRRYGHQVQVRERLDGLLRRYPEDLLLLRRVAEFHLETGDPTGAVQTLFTLAARLFDRGNVVGMRQALEQIRVLEPDNARAARLLGLLKERPPVQA